MRTARVVVVLTVMLCAGVVRAGGVTQYPNDSWTECPADWYSVIPPNPDWGVPITLGEMLPIRYYDSDGVSVTFVARSDALQNALPPGLPVYEPAPGRGLVMVSIWNHRDVGDFPRYREAIFFVAVSDSWTEESRYAWYAAAMVVTTEAAQWGGVQGWGYPKIVGEVSCSDRGAKDNEVPARPVKCTASANDQLIMKVEWDARGAHWEQGPWSVWIMSAKDGMLVRAWAPLDGFRLVDNSPGRASIRFGEHPIGQWLATLGVGPSVRHLYARHVLEELHRGLCTPLR